MTNGQGRGKDKTVAGLLGIILGGLGIHHFYLGSNVAGVVYLVVSLAGYGSAVFCCVTISLAGLPCIMGLIEGILLLVMPQPEFDAKYNARVPEGMEFVFSKPAPPAAPPPPPPAQ